MPTPARPSCPEWCDSTHQRPWFPAETDPPREVHRRRFGANAVHVAVERFDDVVGEPRRRATLRLVDADQGPMQRDGDPPNLDEALVVAVYLADGWFPQIVGPGYLTGPGARNLAAQLLQAATLWDQAHQARKSER